MLREVHDTLPGESTIYVGDLARCPYGTRGQDEVRHFAVQIADLLAGQRIKLLVVACNTATAAAFQILARRYPFPVIGVIEPGAEAAIRATRHGRIGVVATDGTVASGAYRRAIVQRMPEAVVVERSASWLVPLIERGSVARATVEAELVPLMRDLRDHRVDVLILGCTHFPLVRDIFESETGGDMVVLDSAVTTAHRVARAIQAQGLAASGPATHRLLVSGPAQAFADRTEAMFHITPAIETVALELDVVG